MISITIKNIYMAVADGNSISIVKFTDSMYFAYEKDETYIEEYKYYLGALTYL